MDLFERKFISKPSVTVVTAFVAFAGKAAHRHPPSLVCTQLPVPGSASRYLSCFNGFCFGVWANFSVWKFAVARAGLEQRPGASRRSPSVMRTVDRWLGSCAMPQKNADERAPPGPFTNLMGINEGINRRLRVPFDRTPRENSRTRCRKAGDDGLRRLPAIFTPEWTMSPKCAHASRLLRLLRNVNPLRQQRLRASGQSATFRAGWAVVITWVTTGVHRCTTSISSGSPLPRAAFAPCICP